VCSCLARKYFLKSSNVMSREISSLTNVCRDSIQVLAVGEKLLSCTKVWAREPSRSVSKACELLLGSIELCNVGSKRKGVTRDCREWR